MYASVRQYIVSRDHAQVDEAAHEVKTGLGPILSKAPGFVAYYVLDAGNNAVVAISIFESKAAEAKAEEMAASWIKQHMASLASSPPRVAEGEVIAHEAK